MLNGCLFMYKFVYARSTFTVQIPYFEWQGLKSEQEQVDYLRTKLLPTDH